jgi:alpha-glucosidase (family GH31 glycosyl hydrolase)
VDNSPEEVLKNIQFLLGIPTLPPFWSLGNHQSRYGYKNFEEFKNVYESYKKNEIPIDTMWIDIDAMEKYELFTVNENFSKLGPYVKDVIHKEGGKFVPIVDIGVSYENLNSTLLQLGKN